MISHCVYVHVKDEFIEEFIKACEENYSNSILEPGNMRFDVLQLENDQSHFLLYESFMNEEDAAAHKKTEHYLEWRDTVAEMMAEPRKSVKYKAIFPSEDEIPW